MSGRSWSSIAVILSLMASFFFFSRLTSNWSAEARVFEQNDLVVELTVLRPELDEFVSELSLVDALHWPAGQCPIEHRASARTIVLFSVYGKP